MSTRRRGRKIWLIAETQAGPMKVYVTRYEPSLDDETATPCEATYDPETHEIEIERVPNDGVMYMRLHHELMHVCTRSSSGDARYKVFGGKTPESRDQREEEVISFFEPVQFDLLTRNGWLKFPKPPRFQ